MDERLKMFKEITECPGVPGYETEVKSLLKKYLGDYASVMHDGLGSIIFKKEGESDRPRIMLAGHMDEIGFMVKRITEDGYLKFQTLGGWWDQVMLAQPVEIITKKGKIPGVIGSKPPHILPREKRNDVMKKKDMFIDVGASDEDEAREKFGIRPGDPVVPVCEFKTMANDKMLMAKAWDDRVGCALFVDLIRDLQNLSHPNTVYGVGTVQEEVGLRGAKTTAELVNPDVGMALEVGLAGDMPGVSADEAPDQLGDGPTILIFDRSMIPNRHLRDLAVETAEENDIPYQFSSMSGGATDAGPIHMQGSGVPSLVLGVPTRYIHSHISIINRDDYELTLQLLTSLVQKLDKETVESLQQ